MTLPDHIQRDHKIIRGRIAYTSNKPDRLGQERGREVFTVVVHNDGRRSLMAHAEIDDRPSVLRFEQLSLDPHWRPTDALSASVWATNCAGQAGSDSPRPKPNAKHSRPSKAA